MSSGVPTVRVKHPLTGGMMTMNAVDYHGQHELWHEQALDYDATAVERLTGSRELDPALRDALASFGGKMANFALEQEGQNYVAMSDVERLQNVRRLDAQVDEQVAKFRAFRRESDEYRSQESQRQAESEAQDARRASDVEPFVTPPDPTQDQGSADQTQGTSLAGEGDQGETTGDQGEQDDQAGPGPSGDYGRSEDIPSDPHSLGIEESSRGKFYVTRGDRRVSRGFTTREDAERTRSSMEAAS